MTRQMSDRQSQFVDKPAVAADPEYISIRDLQKMSAGAIQALRRPVKIKSGTVTVGELRPIRTFEPKPRELVEKIFQGIADWQSTWTDAQKAEAKRILEERGIVTEW